jgi:hypothetical protein
MAAIELQRFQETRKPKKKKKTKKRRTLKFEDGMKIQ